MLDEERLVETARDAATNRGYAVYRDFYDDYVEALRKDESSDNWLEPDNIAWYLFVVRRSLVQRGWKVGKGRPPRFYPPTVHLVEMSEEKTDRSKWRGFISAFRISRLFQFGYGILTSRVSGYTIKDIEMR